MVPENDENDDEAELNAYLSTMGNTVDVDDNNNDQDQDLHAVYYENKTVALLEKKSLLISAHHVQSFKDCMVVDENLLATVPQKVFDCLDQKLLQKKSKNNHFSNPLHTDQIDPHDDLEREKGFMAQALNAALAGRWAMARDGVAFTRPGDYFAEMVKSDDHMEKVALCKAYAKPFRAPRHIGERSAKLKLHLLQISNNLKY